MGATGTKHIPTQPIKLAMLAQMCVALVVLLAVASVVPVGGILLHRPLHMPVTKVDPMDSQMYLTSVLPPHRFRIGGTDPGISAAAIEPTVSLSRSGPYTGKKPPLRFKGSPLV